MYYISIISYICNKCCAIQLQFESFEVLKYYLIRLFTKDILFFKLQVILMIYNIYKHFSMSNTAVIYILFENCDFFLYRKRTAKKLSN